MVLRRGEFGGGKHKYVLSCVDCHDISLSRGGLGDFLKSETKVKIFDIDLCKGCGEC